MTYFNKKILYICSLNSSLGDTINNAYNWLGKVKYIYPNSIVHAVFHVQSYTTAGHILLQRGLVDYIYPINLMSTPFIEMDSFLLEMIKRTEYDIVIFTPWDSIQTYNQVKSMYPAALLLHADTMIPFETTENINDHLYRVAGIDIHDYNRNCLPLIFHKNLNKSFVDDCLSLIHSNGYKRGICLFGISSRPLANVSTTGIQKIVNVCNDNGFYVFICGTHVYNLYNPSVEGVNWEKAHKTEYGSGTCNIVGTGWEKTLQLMESVQYVISGPTGACMIPPLIGVKLIWIAGGDSAIMSGCLHSYTDGKKYLEVKSPCSHYPCGPGTENNKSIKAINCFNSKHPRCLNEELNVEMLGTMLKNI